MKSADMYAWVQPQEARIVDPVVGQGGTESPFQGPILPKAKELYYFDVKKANAKLIEEPSGLDIIN